MRCCLCALLLLAVPQAARAGEDKIANPLTAAEIAEGWLLLFDGQTTFGWDIEGEASAAKGVLTLGGKKTTVALFNTQFNNFEVRLECRCEGDEAGKLLVRRGGAVSSYSLERSPAGNPNWDVLKLKVRFDPASKTEKSDLDYSAAGGGQTTSQGSADGVTGPAQLRIEVPRGSRVLLRNVKVRPTELKSIFNGKDLTGWKEYPGKKSKFAVNAKGELTVKDGPGDLQTEGKWKDFVLQLECRTGGKHLNSGVFFRCREGEYQNGYEAQIQNDFSLDPARAYKVEEYDPKTRAKTGEKTIKSRAKDYGTGAIYRRVPARFQAARDGEWFTMTVIARGNHIATWVNGQQMVDWTDDRPLTDNARKGCCLNAGGISLQGHDPTTDLSFRNFRIAELPASER
jgi:hypothetical protein